MTAVSSAGNLDPNAFPKLGLKPGEVALRRGRAAVVRGIQTSSCQKRMREKASPEHSFNKVSSKFFLHPPYHHSNWAKGYLFLSPNQTVGQQHCSELITVRTTQQILCPKRCLDIQTLSHFNIPESMSSRQKSQTACNARQPPQSRVTSKQCYSDGGSCSTRWDVALPERTLGEGPSSPHATQ